MLSGHVRRIGVMINLQDLDTGMLSPDEGFEMDKTNDISLPAVYGRGS